jgi:hypothetical protein
MHFGAEAQCRVDNCFLHNNYQSSRRRPTAASISAYKVGRCPGRHIYCLVNRPVCGLERTPAGLHPGQYQLLVSADGVRRERHSNGSSQSDNNDGLLHNCGHRPASGPNQRYLKDKFWSDQSNGTLERLTHRTISISPFPTACINPNDRS